MSPRRTVGILAAVVIAGALTLVGVTPAWAATVPVNSWTDFGTLTGSARTMAGGNTYQLATSITNTAPEFLAVSPGDSVTLDVNGHTLTIESVQAGMAGIHGPTTATPGPLAPRAPGSAAEAAVTVLVPEALGVQGAPV